MKSHQRKNHCHKRYLHNAWAKAQVKFGTKIKVAEQQGEVNFGTQAKEQEKIYEKIYPLTLRPALFITFSNDICYLNPYLESNSF